MELIRFGDWVWLRKHFLEDLFLLFYFMCTCVAGLYVSTQHFVFS